MTKVINFEVYFLVQGLFPLDAYTIDSFELQTIETNEEALEDILNSDPLYAPLHLIKASFQEKGAKKSHYLILACSNYPLEVQSNSENLDEEYIKRQITNKIFNLREHLEKELKLITNIDIALPVVVAKSIDEEFEAISTCLFSGYSSSISISQYDEQLKKMLSHRLSRRISIESLEKSGLKNSRFKRALEFYFNSFMASNTSVSFTLLFSSLEALFNLESDKITETIASSTSKIMFVDERVEKKIKYKMKDYYDRRSSYIHGNEPKEITEKRQFDLREIVRKVILIYWQISMTENIFDSKKILEFINDNKLTDLNLSLQLFIKHLEDGEYKDMYDDMLDIIADAEKQ